MGGHTYFYISGLYDPVRFLGPTKIALDACTVEGSGSTATLSCGQPIIAGKSSQCLLFKLRVGPHRTRTVRFCSFTDKDFLAVDPDHGRLYVTYSDFGFTRSGGNPVDMSACDLGNSAGGMGPAGGTPAAPVCEHGGSYVRVSTHLLQRRPYLMVAPPSPAGCENEGAYPAIDPATGAAYVGFEFNVASSLFFPPCLGSTTPVQEVLSLIVPNFGDYTDNAISVTGTAPFVGNTLFVAWSDGRLGIPQPFEARLPAG